MTMVSVSQSLSIFELCYLNRLFFFFRLTIMFFCEMEEIKYILLNMACFTKRSMVATV